MKLVRVITIVGAIGFALPASTALAQASQDPKPQSGPTANAKTDGDAAAAKPASVSGVEVQATGKSPLADIPPEKRAQFDAEVAKAEAWKRYRQSTPPTSAGVIDQAKDYPGLQALLPAP